MSTQTLNILLGIAIILYIMFLVGMLAGRTAEGRKRYYKRELEAMRDAEAELGIVRNGNNNNGGSSHHGNITSAD